MSCGLASVKSTSSPLSNFCFICWREGKRGGEGEGKKDERERGGEGREREREERGRGERREGEGRGERGEVSVVSPTGIHQVR